MQNHNSHDLQALTLQLSAVSDHLKQASSAAVAHSEQAAQRLGQAGQRLAADTSLAAQKVVQAVQQEAQTALSTGLAQPLSVCEQKLQDSARQIAQAAASLQAMQQQAIQVQRLWFWKVGVLVFGACLLAVLASTWMVWRNTRDLQRIDYNRKVLTAISAGDLNLCGKELCARVTAKTAPVQTPQGYFVRVGAGS
ncbi:MAG: hypothetical protein Q4G70_09690 [Pseudomonadota bacterium]|nr:hypothetical protein [Pseudomonadota bacterium]